MAWVKKRIEKDIVINRRHPSRRSKQDLGVIIFRHLETDKIIGIMANFRTIPQHYPGGTIKFQQITRKSELQDRAVNRQ